MKLGIIGIQTFGEQVGMAVMVAVLHDRRAMTGDCGGHELAHNAAEVRGHEKRFEPRHTLGVQLLVDKAEEVQKVIHCRADVRGRAAMWDRCLRVEMPNFQPRKLARSAFEISLSHPYRVTNVWRQRQAGGLHQADDRCEGGSRFSTGDAGVWQQHYGR